MKLVSVTLKNFRCYLDEKTILIDDLTTFIGKNDVGKSSVLEALEIFFNNDTVKIDPNDCHVSADDQIVEITCEFSDIPDCLVLDASAPTSLADEYLLTRNRNLRVKKTFKCTSAKPKEEVFICAYHPTADKYDDLIVLTNAALKKRLKELEIDEAGVQLSNNPSIRRAIWNNCAELRLSEVEIAVTKEDSKRIWQKINEHLPLFALFQSDRASKDSDSEVQDPMKLAVAAALAEPEIQTKLCEVEDAVREKAVELADRTHQALKEIDPGLAEQLKPEFKAEPKWTGLFSLSLSNEQGIPVNKRGSGVRRLILVSFFRAEAERRLSGDGKKSIIYAIEEPETSQHPNNQRILLESFQDLSAEPECQVILTTHSPGFASYLPIDSFRFITNGDEGQPQIEMAKDSTWEVIVETLGVIPDNRVRVLVCVEGSTDVTALQCLSNALHEDDQTVLNLATDKRVAFVVLGGGSLCHWVNKNYLKGLGRSEIHIYDNDVSKYSESIKKVNARGNGSWGVLTSKREIENYLHPDAIMDGLRLEVEFNDEDDLPAIIKQQRGWSHKTTKRKLAQHAFPMMTAQRIAERDPDGEVEGWLRRIGDML